MLLWFIFKYSIIDFELILIFSKVCLISFGEPVEPEVLTNKHIFLLSER